MVLPPDGPCGAAQELNARPTSGVNGSRTVNQSPRGEGPGSSSGMGPETQPTGLLGLEGRQVFCVDRFTGTSHKRVLTKVEGVEELLVIWRGDDVRRHPERLFPSGTCLSVVEPARPQLDGQTSDGRSVVPKINRALHPFTAHLMKALIRFRIY